MDEDEVVKIFEWIDETLGGPDILLNVAGIGGRTSLLGKRNNAHKLSR